MKQFPVVKASGSNYEVGRAIGVAMAGAIHAALGKNKNLKLSKKYQEFAQKFFPQYIDELKGMANGAGVSFDELFLANNREVSGLADHCTIIAIPTGDGYILGHNEDWEEDSRDFLYIFDGVINGMRIFGLNYADSLMGDSVGINGYGLIEAVNDLRHQDARVGVPKKFIARAILDCKTLEEAEEIIKRVPRAAGFNHVLVQEKRLWNIESSAKEYAIKKIEGKKYVHTNHYLTELKRIDKGNPESVSRYEKVRKLLPSINSVDDIKRVLSDREDPRICRSGTIGSVILDPQNHVAHIAYGQPTVNSYYEFKY
ncbi:hypothetical protein HY410_00495 [Candidatus Gottesmanbacteria bacterium]|nr:hypothetical protein [Candidatus Gottesmanbacteria bacterium]